MQNNPTKIIIHHSADQSKGDQFAKINEYHRSLGFPISSLGFFVGYTYLINREGKVTKCRNHEDEQAHTKGLNFDSLGICLEGNFNLEMPTDAQKDALGRLLVELCDEEHYDVTDIYPHRAFRNTDCYGNNLDNNWARVLYLDYKVRDKKDTPTCSANQ